MDVANEILDAIEIIVDKKIKEQTTQIYPGICKSVNGNSCVMSINGKDNTVQFYGSAPIVGTIYRVFVPYGNMSMAFIITANDNGSSASGVSSVNGLTGDVNLIASDVGAAPAGYGLGNTAYGTNAGTLANIDTYVENGWWRFDVVGTYDAIGVSANHSVLRVDAGRTIVQTLFLSSYDAVVTRRKIATESAWGEWEWVNPPMAAGVEYRTTERYHGKPVYCMTKFVGEVAANTVTQVIINDSDIGKYCIRAFCTGKRTFGNWGDDTTTMVSSPAGSDTIITCDPTVYRLNEGYRSIRAYIKSSVSLKDVYCTAYYTKWAD